MAGQGQRIVQGVEKKTESTEVVNLLTKVNKLYDGEQVPMDTCVMPGA